MKYNRVVIKISGEALAGEKKTGFDFDFVSGVCQTVKAASASSSAAATSGAASRTARGRSSASAPTAWACSPPA